MSWLQKAVLFLKNSGQQNNSETLSINQVQEWLHQRSQEIVEQNNLLSLVKEHAKILEDKRWALEVQLDAWLKKARLHPSASEVIPLFRETRQILELLHFSNQPAMGEVLAVNQELEKRLSALAEKIEALDFSHDFSFILESNEVDKNEVGNNGVVGNGVDSKGIGSNGVESRDVGSNNDRNNIAGSNIVNTYTNPDTNPLLAALLDLDAVRKKLDNAFMESKYHALQVIGSKADHLCKMSAYLQQLNGEIEAKKNRLAAAEQKKQEKEKFLQQLNSDKKNLDLSELAKKKKELQAKTDELEMEILSFFSKIKPLLQQYKELEPSNGLLFSYIKDPLSSFLQDEGLFVLEILAKINVLLGEGKFHLNPEAMLSSLSALEGIYNQRLRTIKSEYKLLQGELLEVNCQINHNFFMIKVEDAAYRLDHYNKQTNKLERDISLLLEKKSKFESMLLCEREEFQSLTKSILGREIKVI